MKDRCIDDVTIHRSFVSRSYRKDLSSCATTFCFWKVWHRAWLSTGTLQWRSGKMSAHAPLLEPFERPGLLFFFCKHKLARVFSAETTSFFLQEVCQPRRLWEEALKRKQMQRTSLPCFTCSTSVTKFTPVTTIVFLLSEICAVCDSKETLLKTATLIVLVWAYPCEMKISYFSF